uniref:RNase H type-1 domain-containing protein n=1 Tax=Cannabis sativa TaxID=3483 RepID=A0A803P2V0_CANSA
MLSAYTDLKANDFSLLMCTLWSIWEFRIKKLFRNANPDAAKEGSYQLYTDAAIHDRNSKIGLGAVVKDWNGQVVAGVSVPLSAKITPAMDEAMALRLGLNWCCNVRIPLSTIFTDCKQLVSKVYSRKRELSALADVISDIQSSLSHFPNAAVCHTPRDNNIHAHHMAKGALGLDEELVWKDNYPN